LSSDNFRLRVDAAGVNRGEASSKCEGQTVTSKINSRDHAARATATDIRGIAEVSFTQKELRQFGQRLQQVPVWADARGRWPPSPTWARGQKLDPRVRAAWVDWETAPRDRKPSYTRLARKFFGHADCCICGAKESVAFTNYGYFCERCCTPYFLLNPRPGERPSPLLKLKPGAPVETFEPALKLSGPDTKRCSKRMENAIRRLHKLSKRWFSSL
jgi:hypothetical protein